jgi:hypothetical protein
MRTIKSQMRNGLFDNNKIDKMTKELGFEKLIEDFLNIKELDCSHKLEKILVYLNYRKRGLGLYNEYLVQFDNDSLNNLKTINSKYDSEIRPINAEIKNKVFKENKIIVVFGYDDTWYKQNSTKYIIIYKLNSPVLMLANDKEWLDVNHDYYEKINNVTKGQTFFDTKSLAYFEIDDKIYNFLYDKYLKQYEH